MVRRKILCPGENQPQHDLVETPCALAQLVVEHFKPSGHVLDPARGGGAFYDAFKDRPGVTADWCEIREGRDFFERGGEYDWIITNPPWSIMRRFLNHSMKLADNIVLLVTLTHLDTRARDREIEAAGFGRREALIVPQPPSSLWPTSGFLLTAYHLQRGYCGDLKFNRTFIQEKPSLWRAMDTAKKERSKRLSSPGKQERAIAHTGTQMVLV